MKFFNFESKMQVQFPQYMHQKCFKIEHVMNKFRGEKEHKKHYFSTLTKHRIEGGNNFCKIYFPNEFVNSEQYGRFIIFHEKIFDFS